MSSCHRAPGSPRQFETDGMKLSPRARPTALGNVDEPASRCHVVSRLFKRRVVSVTGLTSVTRHVDGRGDPLPNRLWRPQGWPVPARSYSEKVMIINGRTNWSLSIRSLPHSLHPSSHSASTTSLACKHHSIDIIFTDSAGLHLLRSTYLVELNVAVERNPLTPYMSCYNRLPTY